jgi:hypothetical protein
MSLVEKTKWLRSRVTIPVLFVAGSGSPAWNAPITGEQLKATLAERVVDWGIATDRFLLGCWPWKSRPFQPTRQIKAARFILEENVPDCWSLGRSEFQPVARIAEALRQAEKAVPESCTMGFGKGGTFWVKLRIRGSAGEACELSKPLAISLAVARALKVEVPS